MNKRKLSPKEIAEIYFNHPAIFSNHEVIIVEKLDDGTKRMFTEIDGKKYLISQSISGHDSWYEIQNGS